MDVTSSCGIKPVTGIPTGRVYINGVEITRDAIAQEMQNHPSERSNEAWTSAARALAIRELLLQDAKAIGLQAEPITDDEGRRETEDEALVRGVIETQVITPEPDAATCKRYYDQNIRRFRAPDLYEVDHILLAAAPGDEENRAIAQKKATSIIAELQSAPSAFATLATEYSACPSRDLGGNLGQIGPGQTVPEFETALATIEPGCIHSTPVETRYGFHVVRVNRHQAGRQIPFEIIEPKIADYLTEHVRNTAIRQYIGLLAGRAVVKGIDLASSSTPLVQ